MWNLLLLSSLAIASPSEDSKEATQVEDSEKTAQTAESSDDYSGESEAQKRPYVFGWLDYPEPTVTLRGGTTTGTPVTVDENVGESWTALQAEELTDLERDRRAILAMAGEYRVSFDFLEMELYGDHQVPTNPYRSWATERVYVVSETDRSVSLQHIIVMFFLDEEGVERGPMVMKHWRQDWEYEPDSALEFIGEAHWTNRKLSRKERKGIWQQTVYQVDDSPRYAMQGEWSHNGSFSAWNGRAAWRPLPRREYSTRSDYQTLVGTNRITVHPRGWVHTQDNIKTVLEGAGLIDRKTPALAREYGVNRYDRIVDFDFSAGDEYWERTQGYWGDVRTAWEQHLSASETIRIEPECNEERIFMTLFGLAEAESTPENSGESPSDAAAAVVDCAVSAANSAR
jgi:hypothetical protein